MKKKHGENWKEQTTIDLEGMHIKSIAKNCFKGFNGIEILKLNDNNLKTIKPHYFENLPYINKIDLSNNEIDIEVKNFNIVEFVQSLKDLNKDRTGNIELILIGNPKTFNSTIYDGTKSLKHLDIIHDKEKS